MRMRLALVMGCLLLAGLPPLHAQSPAPGAAPAAKRQRLALVVGIGSLGSRVVLESALRDSNAVAAALRSGGFEVLLRQDTSGAELRAAIKEFRDRLRADAVGLIYITGLAAQVDGRNLLLPADLGLADNLPAPAVATVLRAAGVPLQEAVDALAGGPDSPRLLLLDAAYRHPPLARLVPPGLARQRLVPYTMALLGHAPGALQEMPTVAPLPAEAPAPANARELAASLFARVVVDALGTPRINAPEALRAIRLAVLDGSRGRAQPWLAGDTSPREDLSDAALLEAPAAPPAPVAALTATPITPVTAPGAVAVPERRATDGRTAAAPGGGERPVFQARINSYGHAEGDLLSYQLSDTRKDEVLRSYTVAIDEVRPDGQLAANGGQFQFDAQGRIKLERSKDGAQSSYEPAQDLWWARPQSGESRGVVFKESYVLADKSRGQIEWRGTSQVGTQRVLETQAGEFEVLPIKTSGQATQTPAGGPPTVLQFTRTVWFAPKLGLPVAIDIEDNDASGKPLRRERIELTHAQQARTAN